MIETEAALLYEAWRTATPVAPPVERDEGLSIADAYAIQRAWIGRREADGARRVGRKVGLTSAAMQEMLGVRQPDFGVLLDDMVVSAANRIDSRGLIAPRVEPEIAFELAAPLEGDVGVDDVLAATARVRGALEIIDSRVEAWRISIVDTVADNASSALVVLGDDSIDVASIDLAAETVTMTVGAETVEGRGDAVLGQPAAAVAWLAATLAEHGERLEAGEIILPGAMTRALPVAAGDTVRCTFGTLGAIEAAVL